MGRLPASVSPERGRLQAYLAGRSAVLAVLLALGAAIEASGGRFPVALPVLSGLTAASFAATLVSTALLGREPLLWALARAQPVWDVACATGLAYFSGGTFSPMVPSYLVAIIGAAILLYRQGALVVAAGAAGAYGLLSALQFQRLVHPQSAVPLPEAAGADVLLRLLLNAAAFFAVGLLAGYLAEELRRTGQRLEEVRAEVLDLAHLQESILRSLTSGLVALDREGRELFHNRAAEELLGHVGLAVERGAVLGGYFDLDGAMRKEAVFDGGRAVLGYTASPLLDRNRAEQGSLLIFQDLTQFKKLEEDLRRADRLAAVGRLAAGLAHEIRNPLASLSGSVEMLRQNQPPGSEDEALFVIVLRETERLNQLVTNFLHYARPGRLARSPVELGPLVDEVGFFFRQGEGKNHFELENGVPEGTVFAADRSQLEQLLLNLFRNAVEASPEGVRVRVSAAAEAGGVRLEVADDGPGMAPEVAERAFEPFFSSKPGGTGLGLATVHRVVENHRGTVDLETAPGAGTTFVFHLPEA